MSTNCLSAGVGVVDITPPIGVELSGFGFRTKPSEGIHTSLCAKTLCVGDKTNTIAVTSCDLAWLTGNQKRELLEVISQDVPLTTSSWMLACTHTHSGPETRTDYIQSKRLDHGYVASLMQKIAESVKKAYENCEPAVISSGSVEITDIAVNRHVIGEDGKALPECWLRNEEGPVDLNCRLLKIDSAQGDPIALLSNFACHPITIAEKLENGSKLISADFPAVAAKLIKDNTGYELIYTNGCAGNINPIGICTGPETTGEYGKRMADRVINALPGLQPLREEVVSSVSTTLMLGYESYPTVDELRDIILKNEYLFIDDVSELTLEQRSEALITVEWARRFLDLYSMGRTCPQTECELQLMTIGEYCIVGLPFEAFVEIGLKCMELSGVDKSMAVGYANGYLGYLVPPQVYDEGGYEVGSYRAFGYPGPFQRSTAQKIYDFVSAHA